MLQLTGLSTKQFFIDKYVYICVCSRIFFCVRKTRAHRIEREPHYYAAEPPSSVVVRTPLVLLARSIIVLVQLL